MALSWKKSKKEVALENHYEKQAQWHLTLMSLPAIIWVFIFLYIPMPGIILAFKDFNYRDGLFHSKWVGLSNFVYLFKSNDAFRILRNTIVYNLMGLIAGTIVSIVVALLLERVIKKIQLKTIQTLMFLPYFISWVVVGYMAFALFEYDNGVLNKIIAYFGGEKISWYMDLRYWWLIFLIAGLWKTVGFSSIIYYGHLLSIDKSLYESAYIDGCTEWQRVMLITLPMIKTTVIMMVILGLGGMLRSDFGMYFYLSRDSGAIYEVTDVIDTYIMRGIRVTGDISGPTAVGVFQSVVGFILVMITNAIVKKIEPSSRLF